MSCKPLKHASTTPKLSLVTKLMLFYTLSTATLLTAIGLFLYPTFVKIMQNIDNTTHTNLSYECYEKIIITLLFAALSTVLFGYLVARKGLKRLHEFEYKMAQISADSLDQRLSLNDWPKELSSLGQTFNTMLDRIHRSFVQISQFSSDIAHELRTPIHNLQGITEVALLHGAHSQSYQEILVKQMNEYHHLSKLIENLLFFASADHGQLILKKIYFNAQEEILTICDFYQILADEKNITINCKGDAKISADRTLFRRVINNLLSNALNYSRIKGQVDIVIQGDSTHTQILIKDNGIGIENLHLNQIFDRFYRVDSARSEASGGLGLGLAIVKSIIDLHGGTVSIESKPNIGSTVYITLPYK